jgi:hypothetical protein
LQTLEEKIDAMQKTVNALRRYFLISTILTVVFFVLPLIVAVVAVPYIIGQYTDTMNVYQGLLQ